VSAVDAIAAPPDPLVSSARSLFVDAVTAEVVAALGARGVRALLLKGPVLARLLYEGYEQRPYVDSDLLVAPGARARAECVLGGLGFEPLAFDRRDLLGHRPHAEPWGRRSDRGLVDLHSTLSGIDAPPAEVWCTLAAATIPTRVGTVEVEALAPAGVALVVALHAAHHGARASKPAEDLARAVERVVPEVWREAAELASRLGATGAFATGLRTQPRGAVLATELGLPPTGSVEATLRARGAPTTAFGLERLAGTPGVRGKLAVLAAEAVPSVRFMRYSSRVARGGRLGLLAAYLWRTPSLALRAPSALRAWRGARTVTRGR